ncbi:hypothetical protein D9619_004416 [Psilocybe cf. subviscida]|uniref:Nephrocystin 3-like N-terminal domain-containing protein n=1 Tax=Psilocybe cf. subviscida TaxID=2480587 RepID=A0A8H5BQU4_9AGAR|nr:hypothetical protein D9619_004416 [Psilocybe cf. subviscida]
MSLFKGARNTIVYGGNFTAVSNTVAPASPQNDLISLLLDRSATAGLLDAAERFDAPQCDEDTRISMLLGMKHFVQTRNDGSSASIYWLHGPAGVGKSALAQSLGLSLQSEGDHAASFFFSRTAPGRNNGDQLIVTLACQLAINIPAIQPFLAKAVKDYPTIFNATNSVKMQRLIIDPINAVQKRSRWSFRWLLRRLAKRKLHPRLILVDGLDECNNLETQRDLIICIGQAVRRLALPFRFVITSRPESHIVSTFHHDPLFSGPQGVNLVAKDLGRDADADEQIATFLRKEFAEIRRSHPIRSFLPEGWPHTDQIAQLVAKSSKGFIYPATVIRYIKMPMRRPDECLERILGLSHIPVEDKPYEPIDSLYRHIFESIPDANKQSVRDIFHHLLCSDSSNALRIPSVIEECLDYKPGHVRHVLGDLLCIVEALTDEKPIEILHASLPDFLLDSRRSESLFISIGDVHARLASSYYRMFGSCFGKTLGKNTYSYTFLGHIARANITDNLLDVVRGLDITKVYSGACVSQGVKFNEGRLALEFTVIRRDLMTYIVLLLGKPPVADIMCHISALMGYIKEQFWLANDFRAMEEVIRPILNTSLADIIVNESAPGTKILAQEARETIVRVYMFTLIPLLSWTSPEEISFDDNFDVDTSAGSRCPHLVQILLSPHRREWLCSNLGEETRQVLTKLIVAFLEWLPYSRPLLEFLDELANTEMLPGESFSSLMLTLSPHVMEYIERVQPETSGSNFHHLLQVATNWVEHISTLYPHASRIRRTKHCGGDFAVGGGGGGGGVGDLANPLSVNLLHPPHARRIGDHRPYLRASFRH